MGGLPRKYFWRILSFSTAGYFAYKFGKWYYQPEFGKVYNSAGELVYIAGVTDPEGPPPVHNRQRKLPVAPDDSRDEMQRIADSCDILTYKRGNRFFVSSKDVP